MEILKEKLTWQQLSSREGRFYQEMIKAVVDVKLALLAIEGEMHSDLEGLFLDNGSAQQDLWGINLYPDREGDARIEYTSFINIRPSEGNRSMEVEDSEVRNRIRAIVENWIPS